MSTRGLRLTCADAKGDVVMPVAIDELLSLSDHVCLLTGGESEWTESAHHDAPHATPN